MHHDEHRGGAGLPDNQNPGDLPLSGAEVGPGSLPVKVPRAAVPARSCPGGRSTDRGGGIRVAVGIGARCLLPRTVPAVAGLDDLEYRVAFAATLDSSSHQRLAAHPDPALRALWARRTDLPEELVVDRIAHEPRAGVLALLAAQPAAAPLLGRLAADRRSTVAAAAVGNRSTPDDECAAAVRRLLLRPGESAALTAAIRRVGPQALLERPATRAAVLECGGFGLFDYVGPHLETDADNDRFADRFVTLLDGSTEAARVLYRWAAPPVAADRVARHLAGAIADRDLLFSQWADPDALGLVRDVVRRAASPRGTFALYWQLRDRAGFDRRPGSHTAAVSAVRQLLDLSVGADDDGAAEHLASLLARALLGNPWVGSGCVDHLLTMSFDYYAIRRSGLQRLRLGPDAARICWLAESGYRDGQPTAAAAAAATPQAVLALADLGAPPASLLSNPRCPLSVALTAPLSAAISAFHDPLGLQRWLEAHLPAAAVARRTGLVAGFTGSAAELVEVAAQLFPSPAADQ
jgi:hypothetical protein